MITLAFSSRKRRPPADPPELQRYLALVRHCFHHSPGVFQFLIYVTKDTLEAAAAGDVDPLDVEPGATP